jgi:hypothetical protein
VDFPVSGIAFVGSVTFCEENVTWVQVYVWDLFYLCKKLWGGKVFNSLDGLKVFFFLSSKRKTKT